MFKKLSEIKNTIHIEFMNYEDWRKCSLRNMLNKNSNMYRSQLYNAWLLEKRKGVG